VFLKWLIATGSHPECGAMYPGILSVLLLHLLIKGSQSCRWTSVLGLSHIDFELGQERWLNIPMSGVQLGSFWFMFGFNAICSVALTMIQ